MYLLDTNIISAMRLASKGKGDPKLMAWAKSHDDSLFYTNVVVLMELEKGILNIQRKDPTQATALKKWYDTIVLPSFKGRILKVDDRTASICAKLHIPDPSPENDSWICASAIQHGLTLVTRNTKDFDNPYVTLFNPFE